MPETDSAPDPSAGAPPDWKSRRPPALSALRRAVSGESAPEDGAAATVRGWLAGRRSSGKLLFLRFRDGSGAAQVVVARAAVPEDDFAAAKQAPLESAVEIEGRAFAEPRAPGGMELRADRFRVLYAAEPSYPITPKEHGASFLLDNRHLWLRSGKQHALLRVRDEVLFAFREYLREQGFVNADTPIFTPNACEGTTTLFETRYFDQRAYLSQSGQLYNEAVAMSVGRTYCLGPTFRAEKSKTRRHLIEFWMLEPEVMFADLDEIVALAEGLICHAVARVLENRRPELDTLERDAAALETVRPPFPRMTYDEAADLLEGKTDFTRGDDFGAPDETALTEGRDRPLVVTRFPTAIKAFYMQPAPERPDRVLGMDILAPEGYGEIVGGGQRIHEPELLRERIREHDLPEEAFAWYADLRRYGCPPHSGFGLGIERFVSWVAGISHLREAIPFPRTLYRLAP